MMTNQRFEALSRICLNNWHYITRKTLSFSKEINFFTGHSGSGKSTVIDAMQIVLYANTDGRGFFNKAAADDSDRNLIEYLRGMVNIGENNEFAYLRNQNFSSTIVLELKRTDTEECQCVGIVFDVETATNEINRKFFWHKGPLWDNGYRNEKRTMTTDEVEDYLKARYSSEEYFYTSHNERFRVQLYDNYLGGLDKNKFPLLFKRAIPFRMNIRLEDFVKEYICMETDIHIEDMQESVMQYGRMRKKIEDTFLEISQLRAMQDRYGAVREKEQEMDRLGYLTDKLEILDLRSRLKELTDRIQAAGDDEKRLESVRDSLDGQIRELTEKGEELLRQISSTGYEDLKAQLVSLNELLEQLVRSQGRWQQTAARLQQWVDQETTSNQTIWDIGEFGKGTIPKERLERLKHSIEEMRKETEQQKQEASAALRDLKRQEKQTKEELAQLKAGSKAYPKYLENARAYIRRRLLEETGKAEDVHVLADLLDIRDDEWRNAVEGYLAGNKLSLVVKPSLAKTAMKIYQELDKQEYYHVAVLDTEKAAESSATVLKNALSEEVMVRESYLQPYMDLMLGRVVKCHDINELRSCRTGITPDCMLYHTFRLQYINPDHYTKSAYIGKDSVRRRIRLLEQELERFEEDRRPHEELIKECDKLLALEAMNQETGTYLEWQSDMAGLLEKQKDKKKLEQKLLKLKEQNVDQWEEERKALLAVCDGKKRERDTVNIQISDRKRDAERYRRDVLEQGEQLADKERRFETDEAMELEVSRVLGIKGDGVASQPVVQVPRYDRMREKYAGKLEKSALDKEDAFQLLLDARVEYARKYPNRNFVPSARDNDAYDMLLGKLQCDHLEEYKAMAAEQAKAAVEHFKDDFMFKIRSAIKEAVQRKDELNRIISRLDFGKDKYQFVIGRNKGADGRFYDMFMDESLEVNPSMLSDTFDNQMNIFTMEHESQYGEMIDELIHIFIPPEHATSEQMEEAKRNMDLYADYRTYLSFDMQQLIQNEDEVIKIRLSKMIKKNSGGEGQNPLYVALLASFAQAYRISLSPRIQRNPTIRLVVLDEAFSKMDAEKVASCIELIRGLGFQAIISATNDKIQNYVENVDKTFVFANPNKKAISIQEFERENFGELVKRLEEEE